MAEKIKHGEGEEMGDADFQFALKELLKAYQPILEEDLKRAKAPEQLSKDAEEEGLTCEDEQALANRIFEKFFTDEVALRLLPAEAKKLLGPIENWRWCLRHIRCCMILGWLICRRQRNFRAFSYYLHRFWICVRQALGTPVSVPPTPEEHKDFEILVQALAGAYKPYLTDQLASVEFPAGIPDEVLTGKIDCFEGEDELAAVFERLFTRETAQALLGKAAYDTHSKLPWFWFCRCWCLCAIRFGCCMARARNMADVARCLKFYRRCLKNCFQPLTCDLTAPTGCAEEKPLAKGGVGLQIEGTAAGGFFDHYTLEWRKVEGRACADDTGWSSIGISYPGGGATGTVQVVGGTLGWINTTLLAPDSFEIRLCVYSTLPNTPRCCDCIQFALFKVLVWIDHVAGAPISPKNPFNPNAVISNAAGDVVPVGCCVYVTGSAFVGECTGRRIKCFDLRWGIGFLPGPAEVGFNPAAYTSSLLVDGGGPVCYVDPDPLIEAGKRAVWNRVIGGTLTTHLVDNIDIPELGIEDLWKRSDYCFRSDVFLPNCADLNHHCGSGKFTLLLDVWDTLDIHYYDTQHVWFDNKPIHVEFGGLEGLPGCTDLHIGPDTKFVPPGAPCGIPWPVNLLGIAYDESIDYFDPGFNVYPNNNFDFYSLTITRQGGPSYEVPITSILPPPAVPPFVPLDPGEVLKGRSRKGDPGTRCEELYPPCPVPVHPGKLYEVLTQLDLRIFDAVCAPSLVVPFAPPAGFALERGTCCGYTFVLHARDRTVSNTSNCHERWALPWAVCICNDLQKNPVD